MNSIGLQNPSVAEFIKEDFNFMKKFDTNIIVNNCLGYPFPESREEQIGRAHV